VLEKEGVIQSRCKSDATRSEEPWRKEAVTCVNLENVFAYTGVKTHGNEATCCMNMLEDKRCAGFSSRVCFWSFPSDGRRLLFHYGSPGAFYGMRNGEKRKKKKSHTHFWQTKIQGLGWKQRWFIIFTVSSWNRGPISSGVGPITLLLFTNQLRLKS